MVSHKLSQIHCIQTMSLFIRSLFVVLYETRYDLHIFPGIFRPIHFKSKIKMPYIRNILVSGSTALSAVYISQHIIIICIYTERGNNTCVYTIYNISKMLLTYCYIMLPCQGVHII